MATRRARRCARGDRPLRPIGTREQLRARGRQVRPACLGDRLHVESPLLRTGRRARSAARAWCRSLSWRTAVDSRSPIRERRLLRAWAKSSSRSITCELPPPSASRGTAQRRSSGSSADANVLRALRAQSRVHRASLEPAQRIATAGQVGRPSSAAARRRATAHLAGQGQARHGLRGTPPSPGTARRRRNANRPTSTSTTRLAPDACAMSADNTVSPESELQTTKPADWRRPARRGVSETASASSRLVHRPVLEERQACSQEPYRGWSRESTSLPVELHAPRRSGGSVASRLVDGHAGRRLARRP